MNNFKTKKIRIAMLFGLTMRDFSNKCFGGEEGIRTLVGFPPNGFQDRLVMTTSIPLRIYFQKYLRQYIIIHQKNEFVKHFLQITLEFF